MSPWMSLRDAAQRLPTSEATLLRVLRAGKESADAYFGGGNWRVKPMLRRTIYQVRESWVTAKAREYPPES